MAFQPQPTPSDGTGLWAVRDEYLTAVSDLAKAKAALQAIITKHGPLLEYMGNIKPLDPETQLYRINPLEWDGPKDFQKYQHYTAGTPFGLYAIKVSSTSAVLAHFLDYEPFSAEFPSLNDAKQAAHNDWIKRMTQALNPAEA